MASKSSGAETPAVDAATGKPEPVAPSAAEPAVQEPNVIAELEATRAKMADLIAVQEKLAKERNDAVAERLRHEAMYRGLQSQTTKTLQKAAQDRRDFEAARLQAAEMDDIRQTLNTLTSHILDDDERKALEYKQREIQLQRREQAFASAAAAAAVAPEAVEEPQQYTTPEDEKTRFLSYYFPGVEVDPNDPNIDWGAGSASTQEAFRRFTTSVLKIKDQKDQAKTNDAVSVLQKQAEEQLAAIKRQQEELAAKTAEDVAAARAEATESARKETEKRLRAMGADVAGTPPAEGGHRTVDQQMTDTLDDRLLTTKKGREQYDQNLEALRKRVREQYFK